MRRGRLLSQSIFCSLGNQIWPLLISTPGVQKKRHCLQRHLRDESDLLRRIIVTCESITPEMLQNTWEVEYRLDICQAPKDSHVEIFWRTVTNLWVFASLNENPMCLSVLVSEICHSVIGLNSERHQMYTNSDPTSKKTQHVSIMKINWLILFK
jgi:hypothetical protein